VPVNATISCTVISVVYGINGVICVGTAFNSIISLSILSLNSCAIPRAVALGRDRSCAPETQLDLSPMLGPFLQYCFGSWVALYTVLFCFPVFISGEVGSMNYVSTVAADVVLIIVAMLFSEKEEGVHET